MSGSAEKPSASASDALPHAGTHQGPGSSTRRDHDDPTERDPTTNTPSQILLEALQNFVIHTAGGKPKEDTGQVHPMGPEAGKLLAALQEFISSMIVQSQVGQTQRIEVDLDDSNVESVSSNDAMVKFPGVATESKVSDPGPLQALVPRQTDYQRFMGRLQEAVREHVFSKMPIRLLHFTDTPRESGTKLQITLLERNDVCDRIIHEIQARFSERTMEERVARESNSRLFSSFAERMRVRTQAYNLMIKEIVQESTRYAILSHTWLRGSDGEVTYGAWRLRQFDIGQPGYQKLANFCRSAWTDHGLSFGWMDTVCINKDSSSELDESIRSMYKWYKISTICITYLAETTALGDIHRDPWFTRGWTFQELLAPDHMSFYNKDWTMFVPYTHPGDKRNPDILDQIFKATTITGDDLRVSNDLPISRKMQLAAKRNVMREEDIAYSLMGVCNVSISIAYGEGAERAFFRLMTEVLNTSQQVVDIFNCAQARGRSSIIPAGPSAYLRGSKDIMRMRHNAPIEPLLLTHVGLRTPILLMHSLKEDDSCLKNDPVGDYYATFQLPALSSNRPTSYYLLDKGIAQSIDDTRRTFGILNFIGDATTLHVQGLCLAVCFRVAERWAHVEWGSTSRSSSTIERVGTEEPIVFHLMKRETSTLGENDTVYSIKRSELAMHGMTLTTMYL